LLKVVRNSPLKMTVFQIMKLSRYNSHSFKIVLIYQYFNAEEYEFKRYREAVGTYQVAEKKTIGTRLIRMLLTQQH
jgi:ABC-type transport system involved in Fe-S cluster assembly fused permease/ATPase subunit